MLTTWEEKAMEKGMEKEKIEIAKQMIQDRMDINLIVKYTGLTLDIIKKMMKEH